LIRGNRVQICMKYKVFLIKSEEGFAVTCPALPGCCSQGKTREEALANIREAIQLWLDVAEEDIRREANQEHDEVALEEVTVYISAHKQIDMMIKRKGALDFQFPRDGVGRGGRF
jgi:predicted RNase H-like HicB family nuclease